MSIVMPEAVKSEEYWNPRYEAYATSHGRTPREQAEHDEQAWPGGKMVGFMVWLQARIAEFAELQSSRPSGMTAVEHGRLVLAMFPALFDAFLNQRALELRKALDSSAAQS